MIHYIYCFGVVVDLL